MNGWTWHLSELLQQQHGLESYELNRKVVAITIFLSVCFSSVSVWFFLFHFIAHHSVCCVCVDSILCFEWPHHRSPLLLLLFSAKVSQDRSFMHRLTNDECQFNYCQMTFSNSFMRCICHWSRSPSSTCPGPYTICPWPIWTSRAIS